MLSDLKILGHHIVKHHHNLHHSNAIWIFTIHLIVCIYIVYIYVFKGLEYNWQIPFYLIRYSSQISMNLLSPLSGTLPLLTLILSPFLGLNQLSFFTHGLCGLFFLIGFASKILTYWHTLDLNEGHFEEALSFALWI